MAKLIINHPQLSEEAKEIIYGSTLITTAIALAYAYIWIFSII